MIAVFADKVPYLDRNMVFLPKKNFKRIINDGSIKGYRFTGLILIHGWDRNEKLRELMEYLKISQPELFKDI
jgi:hypothetical protein